jgi:hypothetical protein
MKDTNQAHNSEDQDEGPSAPLLPPVPFLAPEPRPDRRSVLHIAVVQPASTKLKSCVACGGPLSKSARACPQCGHRQPSKAKTVKVISALALCIGIVLAMAQVSLGFFLLLVGFFGFVIGRFME